MANKRANGGRILVAGITWKNIARIAYEGTYDTNLYRYVYERGYTGARIRRIPIAEVGTTAMLDPNNWETVYQNTIIKEA